jgi:hypothetical protein
MAGAETYGGKGLIADPIHHYIPFTRPEGGIPGEATEQDLIDTPWVQRLRRIPQLQSARWVFPTAEHSRFTHALGAMHVAGRFAQQLVPSLGRLPRRPRPISSSCGWRSAPRHRARPFRPSSTTTSSLTTATHRLVGQRIIRR